MTRSDFFRSIKLNSIHIRGTAYQDSAGEVNISQGSESPTDKMLLQVGCEETGYTIAYLTDKQAARLATAIHDYLSVRKRSGTPNAAK